MSYITEIKAFHDLIQINQLSTGQIALWYALFNINNKCGWIEWFTVPSQVLQLSTGLSRQAIYNARNVLSQKGYIQFKETGNGKASKYKIYTLSKTVQDTLQDSVQDTLHYTRQDSVQDTVPLNRLDKTRQDKTRHIKENIKKEKIVCEFFNELWEIYPRKQGKQNVTAKSMMDINNIGREKMMSAVNAYKQYVRDNEVEEKYIKMGSTFFNGGYIDYLSDDKPMQVLTDPNYKTFEDVKNMTNDEMRDLI